MHGASHVIHDRQWGVDEIPACLNHQLSLAPGASAIGATSQQDVCGVPIARTFPAALGESKDRAVLCHHGRRDTVR